MPRQPTTPERPPPPRIPLVSMPDNRGQTTTQDAQIVNAYVEKTQMEGLMVVKRPGYLNSGTFFGAGFGVYNWRGKVISLFDGRLYNNGVLQAGGIDEAHGIYTFNEILGASPKLFFKNTAHAYTYDEVAGIVEITQTTVINTTGNTHSTAVIDGIPSTAGLAANDSVTGAGIPQGAYIVSVDSGVQITLNVPATATTAAVPLQFVTIGYPAMTARGSAYLDGTMYVMIPATPAAAIFGSGINDLTPPAWEPLNFILVQIEPDQGVCLAKQLIYVIAFKQWSTEVFYDVGNPVGSPLGPVEGGKISFGCRSAESVCELEDTLLYVSTTRAGNVGVRMIRNLKDEKVSTPPIDRLLQQASFTEVWSLGINLSGHQFYILTLKSANLTLVYDLSTKLWSRWTDTNGNYFPFVSSTFNALGQILIQNEADGCLYQMDSVHYTDAGSTITVDIITPPYDGGTRKKKTLNKMDVLGDQIAGAVVKVRVSDNDYQSWTNFRTLDLNRARPYLIGCGSFYKRAWHFRHANNTPFRIGEIEPHMDVGE